MATTFRGLTEPTPFAKYWGIQSLGVYDAKCGTYTLEVVARPELRAFFRGVHGGALAGLFDDAAGMLAYHIYGVNSAVTEQIMVRFHDMTYPGRPLTVYVSIRYGTDDRIYITGTIKDGDILIADMYSVWRRR